MPRLTQNTKNLRQWKREFSTLAYAETQFIVNDIPYDKKIFKERLQQVKRNIKAFEKPERKRLEKVS